MSQPPAYSPSTDFSEDEADNTGGRSTVRTDRVDAELAAIAASISGIRTNLALIQRDDGDLIDALVELHNLSASCRAALVTNWVARGLWATSTAYAVGDMVDVTGSSYVCAVAHTSGVFATDYAAGKWQIFVTASTAGGVSFTPTTTVTSATAQAAIEEVDTKLRAASLPVLSALYGAI
jgi:hypothetical protein